MTRNALYANSGIISSSGLPEISISDGLIICWCSVVTVADGDIPRVYTPTCIILNMKIKTVFLGSNWESVATLKTLNEDDRFGIVGVITQPDKPVGRKKQLQPTPVKEYALEHSLEVYFTQNNEERYIEALEQFKPDLAVVKAFGEIIPEIFLKTPKYGAINVHFSLLPLHRGAVPIQAAILNGDTKTGISIQIMEDGIDVGDIIGEYEENILPNDTNQSLRERLVKKASEVLPDLLIEFMEGKITPRKQDESKATYCYKKDISKENAQIDWTNTESNRIERMIRAFIPWPVAWTELDGKRMKIFEAKLVHETELKPGEFKKHNHQLLVGTKEINTQLSILNLQFEGKRRMKVEEFLPGYN